MNIAVHGFVFVLLSGVEEGRSHESQRGSSLLHARPEMTQHRTNEQFSPNTINNKYREIIFGKLVVSVHRHLGFSPL